MVENWGELGDLHDTVVKNAVKEGNAHGVSSKKSGHTKKGQFLIDFPLAITQFENAMQKFPVKKILYRSVFRGKGLEFDSYRLYSDGDDASLIDWKASLRANEMLSKQYIEERDLNVYFLVSFPQAPNKSGQAPCVGNPSGKIPDRSPTKRGQEPE